MTYITQQASTFTSNFFHALGFQQEHEKDYLLSKEQFIKFRDAYKELAHKKQLKSSDIVLYNVIRGKPVGHGFTPVTNPIKLTNGQFANQGICYALGNLRFSLTRQLSILSTRFGGSIDSDNVNKIMEAAKTTGDYYK